MSLSVEELKVLEHQLEQDLFNLNIGCLSAYGRSDQIRKELAALRELIAIKEAKPEFWLAEMFKDDPESAVSVSKGGHWSIPLIRKPE